jgi:branched-chain amino acid transport system permease protein
LSEFFAHLAAERRELRPAAVHAQFGTDADLQHDGRAEFRAHQLLHAGAYLAYTISGLVGFWPALVLAPLVVGALGAAVRALQPARVHKFGHVPELLVTFGLSYLILELVQLIWGRSTVPYGLPTQLQGPLFTLYGTQFPKSRSFIMLVALVMLAGVWLLLTRTRIGLVIQAALTHPEMVEALGHNVPRVFMLVFGGGAALAGLAGVIGGNTYVTEPAMAASVGSIIFVVVVVGGMGSLAGAFLASLLIGVVQTFAVALDYSLATRRSGGWAWPSPTRPSATAAVADRLAGGAHPAVPVPGADPDLPAQGPARNAGGLT